MRPTRSWRPGLSATRSRCSTNSTVVHGGWPRSRADAEDLVKDTMLKAYTGFRSLRQGTHLKPWLFRIMHNT
jgi:Sigma-70 region 2